jgi:general secretion pathway protein D
VGTHYEQLPASDQRVRYIHYLSNIKTEGEAADNDTLKILEAWLPKPDSVFKIDAATNSLLIMAPSNDIRAIMPVLLALDQPGSKERLEIIPLRHTEAKTVADLFNNNILPTAEPNRYRLDAKKISEATFFSKHIRIIANERRNNLIVLGRPQAIDRVREFIRNYIDIEHDTGRSILHTYQLQYLSAPAFTKVLENILQQKDTGGLEQSTGGAQKAIGPQRYFGEVIIATDTPPDSEVSETETEGEGAAEKKPRYYGGNKLIIACRSDDWKRIRALIEKLDQPSPQVLIEVLIADLTLDDTKALGAALRNPQLIPMPGETAFQSAQLSPGVLPDSISNPQTIGLLENKECQVTAAADLLRTFGTENGQRVDNGTTSIASLLAPGTTALSFSDKDGKTSVIAQILKVLDHRKVLSHPHVLSTSNKKAVIEITEQRRLPDAASGSSGNTVVRTQKDINASLKVAITPRISISELQTTSVNLQVNIDIDQFLSPTSNTRLTRNVNTNVTLNSGDIVALGGLIRSNENDTISETPVLGKIPVIGWLFKNRSRIKQRTNLTVFIAPTVILPRLRDGMEEYTRDYLGISREWATSGGMFDTLKDPITRWFFHEESSTEQFTKQFLKNDIRFQNVPMPEKQIKQGYYVQHDQDQSDLNTNKQPTALAEHLQDQSDQLKELFKDVDDPFKQLLATPIAKNTEDSPDKAMAPPPKRRGRRK